MVLRHIKYLFRILLQKLNGLLVLLLLDKYLCLVEDNLRVLIVRIVVPASLSFSFILSLK